MSFVVSCFLIGISGLALLGALVALWQSFRIVFGAERGALRTISEPARSFREEAEALVAKRLAASTARTGEDEGTQ